MSEDNRKTFHPFVGVNNQLLVFSKRIRRGRRCDQHSWWDYLVPESV